MGNRLIHFLQEVLPLHPKYDKRSCKKLLRWTRKRLDIVSLRLDEATFNKFILQDLKTQQNGEHVVVSPSSEQEKRVPVLARSGKDRHTKRATKRNTMPASEQKTARPTPSFVSPEQAPIQEEWETFTGWQTDRQPDTTTKRNTAPASPEQQVARPAPSVMVSPEQVPVQEWETFTGWDSMSNGFRWELHARQLAAVETEHKPEAEEESKGEESDEEMQPIESWGPSDEELSPIRKDSSMEVDNATQTKQEVHLLEIPQDNHSDTSMSSPTSPEEQLLLGIMDRNLFEDTVIPAYKLLEIESHEVGVGAERRVRINEEMNEVRFYVPDDGTEESYVDHFAEIAIN